MGFTVTNKPRIYVEAYDDGVALHFRDWTTDERLKFFKELAKIRNVKDFIEKLNVLLAQLASALLLEWHGIEDEHGDPLEMNRDTAMAFFSDELSRKYWYKWLNSYIWPNKAEKGKKAVEDVSDDGDVNPDFFGNT